MDALNKKSIWFEGIRNKNHQDDGAKRALSFYKEESATLILNDLPP
jgi:hypothetical protein